MWGVAGMTLLNSLMCASTWPSGRSDPNPEQVFGQAFGTLTGLGIWLGEQNAPNGQYTNCQNHDSEHLRNWR